jgi:hypothetical protein
MLQSWPTAEASGCSADTAINTTTTSSSSSSSTGHSQRSEPVRYGKIVLPKLPQVTHAAALPAALATAETLAGVIDKVQQELELGGEEVAGYF